MSEELIRAFQHDTLKEIGKRLENAINVAENIQDLRFNEREFKALLKALYSVEDLIAENMEK